MKTVAIIDIGSNSIKLLVAELATDKQSIQTVFTKTIETRISAGISQATPVLTEAAILSGIQTIQKLLDLAADYSPEHIKLVATSAVRDAHNGHDFAKRVKETTDQPVNILSGNEEASCIGRGLACDPIVQKFQNFIQIDLGGGSLELIHFASGKIVNALSLKLGAVRLLEAHVEDPKAPLTHRAQNAIINTVLTNLKESAFDFADPETPLIATGGAFTVSRAIFAAQKQQSFETLSPKFALTELIALRKKLSQMTLEQRLQIPNLPSGRADILPTALLTIETVMKYAERTQCIHSLYNLRYGIAATLLNS